MCSSKNPCLFVLICLALLTSACSNKEGATESKAETQVVAKVNGDEISVHQINFQLGRVTQNSRVQLTEAQGKQAAEQILARLVDQQLLKQQAIEAKLDRDPRVLQAIESSKNEILAQAYLEREMQNASKPSVSDIDTFYSEHPELFSERRVFRLQELVVDVNQDKHEEIEDSLKTIKGINEIANWLKSKNYAFNANSNVKAAEQLPMEILRKIQLLKDGEFIVIPTDRALNIVHLAASQSAPISRDKATSIIEQYFLNQAKTDLAKKELAELNKNAKIEFIGAFSEMKKSDLASSKLGSEDGKISKAADLKAPSEAKTAQQPVKPSVSESNIDKGLAGL
jgi:EpsD family peptidyl-prolyl cis-trans isomerase